MKVKEFLELFPEEYKDADLWIADGYEGTNYFGPFKINVLTDVDGSKYCEVEIGGLMVN